VRSTSRELSYNASEMYARNLLNSSSPALDKGELAIDWKTEYSRSRVSRTAARSKRQHASPSKPDRRLEHDRYCCLYIFMLAAFTGYEVILAVRVILHTPLMSGSNSCTVSCLVGGWLRSGALTRRSRRRSVSLAYCLRGNAVGGFVVMTDARNVQVERYARQGAAEGGALMPSDATVLNREPDPVELPGDRCAVHSRPQAHELACHARSVHLVGGQRNAGRTVCHSCIPG